MNEQLQQKLVESIDSVQEWIDKGAEFATDQAPLVIAEIIAWGKLSAILDIATGLSLIIIIAAAFATGRGLVRIWGADDFDLGLYTAAGGLVSVLFVGVNVIVVAIAIQQLIFVAAAPRLYVLSELSELIN